MEALVNLMVMFNTSIKSGRALPKLSSWLTY